MNLSFIYIPEIFGVSIEVYAILLILGVPLYFFWRWLFHKFMTTGRKRIFVIWLSTLISTPLIYIGLVLLLIFGMYSYPKRDFDKSSWFNEPEGRFEMASDLIKSNILIGKDTNQLKQILGSSNWQDDTTKEWSYEMGMGGGYFSNILNVKFQNNKVVKVEHEKIDD